MEIQARALLLLICIGMPSITIASNKCVIIESAFLELRADAH